MRRIVVFCLLLMSLTACASQQELDAMATMQAATGTAWNSTSVAHAVETVVAAGTPMPTWTSSPMPTATPTVTPTPTNTPVTGWVLYSDNGEQRIQDMPSGYVPACDGLLGCPGKYYQQYIQGVPVPAEEGGVAGTPLYWGWVLAGVPIGLGFLVILGVGMYTSTAPTRELAQGIKAIMAAQAKLLESSQQQIQASDEVSNEKLVCWLRGFISQNADLPQDFVPTIRGDLAQYQPGAAIPLQAVVAMLQKFDRQHRTTITARFGTYVEKESRQTHITKR
jgi:hypothetical protein